MTHTTLPLQNRPALEHNKHEEQRDYSSKNKSILLIISNNLLYDEAGCISPCAPRRRPRTHQTLTMDDTDTFKGDLEQFGEFSQGVEDAIQGIMEEILSQTKHPI